MTTPIANKNLLIIALLVLAALSRLIPHPPNMTAVGAMAIFGGAYLAKDWRVLLLPIVCLWGSNLLLNNIVYSQYYEGFSFGFEGMGWIFASFILIMLLSKAMLARVTGPRVLMTSLASSTLFFIVSNFGVWVSGTMYPKTLEGLTQAYVAAIPFFGNTIGGDLFFCAVLFGSVALAERKHLVTA